MKIKTQKEAIADGDTHYFTGKPCARGHVSKRGVNSRQCVDCRKVIDNKWREANKEQFAAIQHAGYKRRKAAVSG